MGLISFTEALKHIPTGKTFVVDTSFIIRSLVNNSPEHKVRKAFAGKVGLIYNVVIRKEVLHLMRYHMVETAFEKKIPTTHQRIQKLWSMHDQHTRLKQLCDEGYAELFREIFGESGEKLEKEVQHTMAGCLYADGRKNSSTWENVHKLMATYGLDSSDAMIVNFAANDATYSGIITSDGDFRVCGDVQSKYSFDVILPDSARNRVLKKEWRPD